jgi:enoyl-CoA hydratase
MALTVARHEEFAVITLNRPEALNALSVGLLRDLATVFDDVAASDARGLILTGAGDRAFCAGADIAELMGRTLAAQRDGALYGQGVFARLDRMLMPSFAVINGFALGGGLELALACTFRLAARNARLGCPEVKLGLIPGYGGTQRLPRLIGEGRALDLIMTGRMVEAEEAERIGLVHRIVEGEPLAAAVAFARGITRYGLPALRFAREAVQRALDQPIHEGFKIEADLSTLAYQTEDSREGMTAFLEKRKPVVRDR